MSHYSCDSRGQATWDGIDFSRCFFEVYLQRIIPLSYLIFSFSLLLFFTLRSHLRPHPISTLSALTTPSFSTSQRPTLTSIENSLISNSVQRSLDAKTEDERKFKTMAERLMDWVGVVGSLALVGVRVAGAVMEGGDGSWERVAFFTYLLLLSLIPFFPTLQSTLPRTLSTHFTSLLYLSVLHELFIFRSALLFPHSRTQRVLEIAAFALLCALATGYGLIPYRSLLDEGVTGGLKAGRGQDAGAEGDADGIPRNIIEPTSLFCRTFYNHMIPIVTHHYARPMTLKEIPALREDDVAGVSLANWRLAEQEAMRERREKGITTPRAKLAWRLLWHFRKEFLRQAIWCIPTGIVYFFPTIGLQLLLDFVADRKSTDPATDGRTPTHVAVLYVAMMTFGGIARGATQGQSLDTGRRVCIRVRAIIISEIFAKALRRRDSSGVATAAQKTPTAKVDDTPVDEDLQEDNKLGNKKAEEKKAVVQPDGVGANLTNLVAVDAFFVAEISGYLFYFLSCPLGIIGSVLLLYRLLGVSSLAGVAMIIVLTPVQGLIGKIFTVLQKRMLKATDARLEIATEALGAIKTIKFAAWEDQMFSRMQASRDKELHVLKLRFWAKAVAQIQVQLTPPLVTVVTLYFYTVYFQNPLSASVAFTSLALFGLLRTPLAAMMEMTAVVTNAWVSADRVDKFLNEPETAKYEQLSTPESADEPVLGFRNASITHLTKEESKTNQQSIADGEDTQAYFKMSNINLDFPLGELSIITGPVASGKTTLITSLLGETTLLSGIIFAPNDQGSHELLEKDPATGLRDSIAYCAQTAWLSGSTIRENITFGEPWNKKRYDAVIHACALEKDLEIFAHGDLEEVGEKGTVCSGGQRARIALARAVYSSAKTLVLDDVLSAVDAHTARHLYRTCLKGPLMDNRTVILVTHAVGLVLPGSAWAVVLDAGNVIAAGQPEELRIEGHFAGEEMEDDGEDLPNHAIQEDGHLSVPADDGVDMKTSDLEGQHADLADVQKQADKAVQDLKPEVENLTKAETQAQGTVSYKVYMLYFRSLGGYAFWVICVALFLGAQGAQIETNAWIRDWANASDKHQQSVTKRALQVFLALPTMLVKSASSDEETKWYLFIYIMINIVFCLLIGARTAYLFYGSLTASKNLYERLLHRILGARMRFFDSTPSGQILNRISGDIQTIDQTAAETLLLGVNSLLNTVAVLVVIIFATPEFAYTAAFIIGLYAIIGVLYNNTGREVKRIDSVTKSPILIGFSEALHGMSTIRGYADSARFIRNIFSAMDTNTRAFHLLWQANRILASYCEVAGSLVTVFACVFVLTNEDLDAGAAGLSLTYALSFMDYVLWIIRLYSANEQNMNSVERIGEYLNLEAEEEEDARGVEPPAYWPSKNAGIEVEKLTASYAPGLPAVLKEVSFSVKAGERVGICGRTGSGKSTLALSFFRFIEATSGTIRIDGLDISKMRLHTLRSRLTILPQEAQLFTGTIRENLDVFNEHEDLDIWEALRNVGMASRGSAMGSMAASRAQSRVQSRAGSVHEDEEGTETGLEERISIKSLSERVTKGGLNFSAGQRQLLAMARGLLKLRNSSILILDESTANLDSTSDESIQRVLRENLNDTTMLIIAHRLRTIADCDKILVLDEGKVVEFGSPYELLMREESGFKDLCKRSGEEATLFAMAEKASKKRKST